MGYKDILGHENIIAQLKNAVAGNKVSHAYILNGEDDSGKNMIAEAFAQALLCEKGEPEGCGECHFCRQKESSKWKNCYYVSNR